MRRVRHAKNPLHYADEPNCQKINNAAKRRGCLDAAATRTDQTRSRQQYQAEEEAKTKFAEIMLLANTGMNTCKHAADVVMGDDNKSNGNGPLDVSKIESVKSCVENTKRQIDPDYKKLKFSLTHNTEATSLLTDWFEIFNAALDSIVPQGAGRESTYKNLVREKENQLGRRASRFLANLAYSTAHWSLAPQKSR